MIVEKNGNEIPDYLNSNFFKAALENGLQVNNIEIISLSYTMGSSGGENYCSYIYRVVIIFATPYTPSRNISLIVKSMPTDGGRAIVEEWKLYEKEAEMYLNLLPKVSLELENTEFAPKCFYAISKPIRTLVFEDLNVRDFKIADREKGLDEHHTAAVLQKLGEFHAASMLLAQKNPQIMNEVNQGLFNKNVIKKKHFRYVFGANLRCTAKVVETWPGYESIAEKLKKLQDSFLEKIGDIVEPTQNELKVLNHGDLWVNNILFKYDENDKNVIDISFVDFQGSVYTSPGIDINYFISTSIPVDVLETRRDFFLKNCYYQSLKSVLEDAKFHPIPMFEEIMDEIRKKEFYGFASAVGILALICMDRESSKDNSIENISDGEEAERKRMIACTTKRYQETIRYNLKRWDKMGLFDL